MDGCPLGLCAHPLSFTPLIVETCHQQVQLVSVGAVKMHVAHVVVGNISLDSLSLMAGTLGIFIAIDIGKEVLHFGSAWFGGDWCYFLGKLNGLTGFGCQLTVVDGHIRVLNVIDRAVVIVD